jgi:hypothetical protein
MKPDLRPYVRTLDLAPRQRLRLPAHVDGQLHLRPATYFLLGAIAGAIAAFLCIAAITLL